MPRCVPGASAPDEPDRGRPAADDARRLRSPASCREERVLYQSSRFTTLLIAHRLDPSCHKGFDGAQRASENVGRLLFRKILVIAEYESGALARREPLHLRPKLVRALDVRKDIARAARKAPLASQIRAFDPASAEQAV